MSGCRDKARSGDRLCDTQNPIAVRCRALAANEGLREQLISIDTFNSAVAREAVAAGAHIVNDVSGGRLDPSMHSVVRPISVVPFTHLPLQVATIPAYAQPIPSLVAWLRDLVLEALRHIWFLPF